jgi:two-component system, OmpR family, sensor kinase
MRPLGIRARFTLATALLVLVIAALVGAGGYLALRQSLLSRAQREAADQARQLAGLVDVGAEGGGRQGNQVDLGDPSLTGGFARGGALVDITRPDGTRIQASPAAPRLPPAARQGCLRTGSARARIDQPPFALACARVGPARRPAALISVAAPLDDARRALAELAQALAIGVAAGALLAAALARALAQRALRPARRIARTANAIRAGDLTTRIGYQGPRDELGELADILDACFAELEAFVHRQRRFVADASHELRTPLATIQAHVQLLRTWAATAPSDRERALAALDSATRAAGRLAADLLYMARMDRRPDMPRRPAQLDDVVVDAVREAQPLRPDVPIRIARLDEAQLPADALALRQLLANLLANALRVSPAGAEVTVELAVAPARARVRVLDRGPGIAQPELERIFEPFHTTAPHRSGSAGLGLAIARDIAARHDGSLHAANRAGGGAVLELTLPVSSDALIEAAPASS